MKKSQIDRTIEAIQAEIQEKLRIIDVLKAHQTAKPLRTRKPRAKKDVTL